MQFGIGFLLAAVISACAYALRSLTFGGALAAIVLGTVVYGFGGWQAAAVLLAFFISSSLLEKLSARLGKHPEGAFAKGGRRDTGQVLGNGSLAGIFAVLMFLNPYVIWSWIAFAGSIAAVNADTWATELGILSTRRPRLITRLSLSVRAGTSGAVSAEGSLAAFLGSTLIATLAAWIAPIPDMRLMLPIALGGLIGALFDSYLGATVQAMYVCTTELLETEQHPKHRCGSPTVHARGWRWLNNDMVNLACASAGSLMALLLSLLGGLI